jgi:replicative DNA helicase
MPANHSADLACERVVLGTVLSRPEEFYDLDLRSDEFHDPKLRAIWGAIIGLAFDGLPIDPISVSQTLGAPWTPEEVAVLREEAADPIRLAYSAERVREAHVDSAVRETARTILSSEDQGSDLLAVGQQAFIELGLSEKDGASVPISVVADEILESAKRRQTGSVLPGAGLTTTGIPPLDEYLSVHRGGVITLAGRPSMGKSSLGLWLILRLLEAGERVLLFTTESTKEEFGARLLSLLTGIPSGKIDSKILSATEMEAVVVATRLVHGFPLWIEDSRRELPRVCREIRRLKALEKITFVGIDHLQEMTSGDRRPPDPRIEINRIVTGLRATTREDPKATLLLLSQLSRGVENRDDKRPLLSDLKESGTIEEISDEVFLLFRPAYYRRDADRDMLEVAVAKNRNGKTGLLRFRWRDDLGQVAGVYDAVDHVWSRNAQGPTMDGKQVSSASLQPTP